MAATDALNSLDSLLTQARQEFAKEKDELQAKLVQAEANAAAYKELLEREADKAGMAIRTAATLIAHLGTVGKVFEEAKNIALGVGADIKTIEQKASGAPTVAKNDLDEAIGRIEGMLHTTTADNTK